MPAGADVLLDTWAFRQYTNSHNDQQQQGGTWQPLMG